MAEMYYCKSCGWIGAKPKIDSAGKTAVCPKCIEPPTAEAVEVVTVALLAKENKQLKNQLSEVAGRSRRLTEAGQTVVNLSHGIKNILQAISAAAETVDYGFKTGQVNRAKLSWNILKRNLERIKRFTLDMLEFSKEHEPEFSACEFNRLVESAVEAIRSEAQEKEASIILETDERIPVALMDGDMIHDVALNLILNAIDAVPGKTGVVKVETKYQRAIRTGRSGAANIVLSVNDNGPGIRQDEKEKIFYPFHSSKAKVGTGLGLPIVRKIVSQHQGKIEVDSTPGAGATFTVLLPVKKVEQQAAASSPK